MPEVIPPSQDPKIFSNSVWVLNVSNNLANKSCNTRGLARVVIYKCNEKGGPFFKDPVEVKSPDFTHYIRAPVAQLVEHWADAGGLEFDSGRTNTQGLKITE